MEKTIVTFEEEPQRDFISGADRGIIAQMDTHESESWPMHCTPDSEKAALDPRLKQMLENSKGA